MDHWAYLDGCGKSRLPQGFDLLATQLVASRQYVRFSGDYNSIKKCLFPDYVNLNISR
jgi:hypothetical protein